MRSHSYFSHLCDLVWSSDYGPKEETQEYEDVLLETLHSMEFSALIPNDDNRYEDGLQLREDYYDSMRGGLLAPLSGPCTVLEMLIALSFRLEFESAQSYWEKTPREWFWVLIDHLSLDPCANFTLSIDEYRHKIEENVTVLVKRRYKSNGEGGLFPLKNPKNDQKKVEIWYQMSAFILENYPI